MWTHMVDRVADTEGRVEIASQILQRITAEVLEMRGLGHDQEDPWAHPD